MDNSPFFIQKHLGGEALPGVLTTPADGDINVDVLYEHVPIDPTLGIENATPFATVQSRQISGKTITNSGATAGSTTLTLPELWEDDNGEPVTDENGTAVYASEIYVHKVKAKKADAEGITILELTKD